MDPLQRPDHGVHEPLHAFLVAVHVVGAHVDAGRGERPAEGLLRLGVVLQVDEDPRLTARHERRDGRLRGDPAVDLAVLERGDEGLAGPDRQPGELARLDAVPEPEVLQLEVGRGAGAGDPHHLALHVRERVDRAVRRNDDRVSGCEADLHHALGGLALACEVDRVVVVAHRGVDLACDERVGLLDPGRRVERVDVDPRLLVVAEVLRQRRHRVDDLVDAADHDRDARALLDVVRPGRRRGRHEHRAQSERETDGE